MASRAARRRRERGLGATRGGGLRASLRSAMGLASALASGGSLAQDVPDAGAAPTEPQFTLPTVKVEDQAEHYNVTESGLARVPTPLLDVPQSVVVVPEVVMQQQQANTLKDALRNVSGITLVSGEAGRQGDVFIIRGYTAQNDVFRDGMRDLGWFTRDTFNIQNVEVYFGPSAIFFGRGSTGGAVNLISKKPYDTTGGSVSVQGGTAPSGRLEGDANVAVSDAFQFRIQAMGQLAHIADRDQASANRAAIAPSFRVRLGERTTLNFDYLYQHESNTPDYGQNYFSPAAGQDGYPVSYNLGVRRQVWYGVTGDNLPDLENVNANIATLKLQQGFGDATALTVGVRYGQVHRLSRPTAPRNLTPVLPATPTTVGRQRYELNTDNDYLVVQADLRTQFKTGILEHTLTSGIELSQEKRAQYRLNSSIPPGNPLTPVNLPADLFNPDPRPDLSQVTWGYVSNNDTTQKIGGVYLADQIAITRFVEIVGSIRYDVFGTDYLATAVTPRTDPGQPLYDPSRTATTDQRKTDNMVNWRAGLVVHPVKEASLYGMYGTSSNPSAELGTFPNGTADLDPEQNAIAEVGAKLELEDGRLSVNASLFRIDKQNARVPGPDPSTPIVLAGKQRVDGYSLSAAGTIVGSWRLLANYTFLDGYILDNPNPVLVGQPLPNTPRRALSAWTTFQLFPGFTLGGGATYVDSATGNNPTFTAASPNFNKVPSYWRFDAVASYVWKALELQLNVYNIGNALFYEQYSGVNAVPAPGRSALLTGTVRF